MERRTKRFVLAAVVALIVAPILGGYAWWRYHYPYGFSHCCDRMLYNGLAQYATTHGGAFPTGQATPEASLSLLYQEKSDWVNANILRGKTVPESVVQEILERGELLTPETCGWHYVEGLRLDDDPRLALFWDKAGLDHNGGRMANGGHVALFIDGQPKHIPEAEWGKFLEEQHRLLAERKTAIHHDATVRIDNDVVKVQVRVVDDGIYGSSWSSGGVSGSEIVATLAKQEFGTQGLPVIPKDEIKNARTVVEQGRVRFVLRGHEIVYDRSGFRVDATPSGPAKK